MVEKVEKSEALEMFKAEAEEERKNQDLSPYELSMKMTGHAKSYENFLHRESCQLGTIQGVADALGMKLVICLLEKNE